MKSQQSMTKAMYGVTKSLRIMNSTMNLPVMQQLAHEFEKQSELSEFNQELLSETVDDVFEAEDEEEKTELMMQQVLDEAGLDLTSNMTSAPSSQLETSRQHDVELDKDLKQRLQNLRGPSSK